MHTAGQCINEYIVRYIFRTFKIETLINSSHYKIYNDLVENLTTTKQYDVI